jgi:hypothetical protein
LPLRRDEKEERKGEIRGVMSTGKMGEERREEKRR